MTETEAILERGNANLARMGMGAETARGPETLAQGGGIAAHTLTGTQFASVGKPVSTPRPDDAFRAAQEGKPAKKRRSDAGVPRKLKVVPAEQPAQGAGKLTPVQIAHIDKLVEAMHNARLNKRLADANELDCQREYYAYLDEITIKP